MPQGLPMGAVAPMVLDEGSIADLACAVVGVNKSVLSQKGFSVDCCSDSFKEEQTDKVMAVISASFSVYFELMPADRYGDLFDQVSSFAFHLAKDHIFTDGYKGTTVLVSLALIRVRGVFLDIEDSEKPEENEVYKWIEDLVTDSKSVEELAGILRSRARLE